ncbi:MAG: heat-inducible transcriptional repressor HrcA [Bacilli bacterium]
MELSRKDLILKLIVEDFIKTAVPVGSNYLITKFKLPYSSATVRNEMATLEEDGLIEKMHTSGGRVPSTLGYKYYVENLKSNSVDSKLKNELKVVFDNSKTVEDVVGESCKILSNMTNLVSVYLGPTSNKERLISVQLIPISKSSATAIFVTDRGYVENKTFIFDKTVNLDDLSKSVKLINDRITGTLISELPEKLETLRPLLKDYINDYTYIFNSIAKAFFEFAADRSEFYGEDNLIKQPEFKDNPEELKKIFELFSKPENLVNMLTHPDKSDKKVDTSSDIGTIDNLSVISREIKIPNSDKELGKIAIVGPKRMDYGKVLNALDYVVKELMNHLSNTDIIVQEGKVKDGHGK